MLRFKTGFSLLIFATELTIAAESHKRCEIRTMSIRVPTTQIEWGKFPKPFLYSACVILHISMLCVYSSVNITLRTTYTILYYYSIVLFNRCVHPFMHSNKVLLTLVHFIILYILDYLVLSLHYYTIMFYQIRK